MGDNILEMDVVTADGSELTVSESSNHFTEDQLEVLFKHLNSLINNGTLPRDVNAYVVLRSKPLISPRVSHNPERRIT